MGTPQIPAAEHRRSARLARVFRAGERSGQTVVEFALVGMAFVAITLGTVDLGRAVYQYHALTSAVRDGAHAGKIDPVDTVGIKDTVIASAPSLRLSYADIDDPVCKGGCVEGCEAVTVSARSPFRPILSSLVDLTAGSGDDPFTIMLSSSATVQSE